MARVHLNAAFAGFSGRSGELVYRRLRGSTIIAQRPEQSGRAPSPAQQRQRERFTQAAEYARQVLSDPHQREIYEALAKERNRRVDKMLASDFLTPPVVSRIDVSKYQRLPGGVIRILATDDIEVVSVEVKIESTAGSLIEQGAATKIHGVWCYHSSATSPAAESLTITATATDRPGHCGSHSVSYP